MFCGVFISLFALHFTQYAWVKFIALASACAKMVYKRCRAIFLLQMANYPPYLVINLFQDYHFTNQFVACIE